MTAERKLSALKLLATFAVTDASHEKLNKSMDLLELLNDDEPEFWPEFWQAAGIDAEFDAMLDAMFVEYSQECMNGIMADLEIPGAVAHASTM